MKTRAFSLLVFSTFGFALGGCLDEPTCPYGEVLVRDGYRGGGVCVRRSSYPGSSGSTTPPSGTSTPPPTAPAPAPTEEGPSAPPPAGTTTPPVLTCGGVAAQGDSVRVVNKTDLTPALGDTGPSLADGSYALVQATFYRTGQSPSPVRSLKAGLDVQGPTLTVNAQDTSVAGLPAESLTFLLASGGSVTKTCESEHGSVSAWFFPFQVGGTSQAQMQYDGSSGFARVIVSRADGATELVFAR
jgi:hypothetical protein